MSTIIEALELYELSCKIVEAAERSSNNIYYVAAWEDEHNQDGGSFRSKEECFKETVESTRALDALLTDAAVERFETFWKTAAEDQTPWSNLAAHMGSLREEIRKALKAMGADMFRKNHDRTAKHGGFQGLLSTLYSDIDSVVDSQDLEPHLLSLGRGVQPTPLPPRQIIEVATIEGEATLNLIGMEHRDTDPDEPEHDPDPPTLEAPETEDETVTSTPSAVTSNEPTAQPVAEKKPRRTREEHNVVCRSYLERRMKTLPKPTIREILDAVGCGTKTLYKLPSFMAVQGALKDGRKPKALKAVSLTDDMAGAASREDGELARLKAEQHRDMRSDTMESRGRARGRRLA